MGSRVTEPVALSKFEEKLCPALLVSGQVRSLSPSLILRSRTALVRSPANLIQGLPDFDWCRGASKPRRCIRSQPLQRARASERVAMWSGYSISQALAPFLARVSVSLLDWRCVQDLFW